ncbi:uncharacterized protein TM35_000411630 [Trypanosoma theileri]|uniref:Uncharacterized protein n=1 Tax=Trypanosoma theileri TaxID=67003 RepID=A0A1X0NK08_9TRYP|nr:uncharacterized protein TM35_000411630 [Trypanosoma theileri]ORC84793.1 hypothetical protein TM35_000411630 [Trypanosoma theileri]
MYNRCIIRIIYFFYTWLLDLSRFRNFLHLVPAVFSVLLLLRFPTVNGIGESVISDGMVGESLTSNSYDGVLRLTNCFPNMIVSPSQTTQYCEVDNANALSNLTLIVGFYTPEGRLIPGWPASLVEGTNLISFVPNSGVFSGDMSLVILNYVQGKGSIPVTNNFTMSFVNSFTTIASFTSNSSYYGLKTMVQTNFPNTNPIQNYLLVPPQSDCNAIGKKCTAAAGCYNLTTSASLPVPGNYSLCLTASGWRGYYLPWGAIPLEVKMLVSHPPYMFTNDMSYLQVEDAITGNFITDEIDVFIVKCLDNECPPVMLDSGNLIVSVNACYYTGTSDRMKVSKIAGSELSIEPGVYAVCIDFGLERGVSPAVLPFIVLSNSFNFLITSNSSILVTFWIEGGDIFWQQQHYLICALMPNNVCNGGPFSPESSVCVKGDFRNSQFITLDVSYLYEKYNVHTNNMTFCFIVYNVTVFNRTFFWSYVLKGVKNEKHSTKKYAKFGKARISGIVVGGFCFVTFIVILLLWFLRRKGYCCFSDEKHSRNTRTPSSLNEVQHVLDFPYNGDSALTVSLPSMPSRRINSIDERTNHSLIPVPSADDGMRHVFPFRHILIAESISLADSVENNSNDISKGNCVSLVEGVSEPIPSTNMYEDGSNLHTSYDVSNRLPSISVETLRDISQQILISSSCSDSNITPLKIKENCTGKDVIIPPLSSNNNNSNPLLGRRKEINEVEYTISNISESVKNTVYTGYHSTCLPEYELGVYHNPFSIAALQTPNKTTDIPIFSTVEEERSESCFGNPLTPLPPSKYSHSSTGRLESCEMQEKRSPSVSCDQHVEKENDNQYKERTSSFRRSVKHHFYYELGTQSRHFSEPTPIPTPDPSLANRLMTKAESCPLIYYTNPALRAPSINPTFMPFYSTKPDYSNLTGTKSNNRISHDYDRYTNTTSNTSNTYTSNSTNSMGMNTNSSGGCPSPFIGFSGGVVSPDSFMGIYGSFVGDDPLPKVIYIDAFDEQAYYNFLNREGSTSTDECTPPQGGSDSSDSESGDSNSTDS